MRSGPAAAIAAELGLRDPEITPLSGGLSNRSWRLRGASQDLVLRESGAAAGELGADSRAELAMLGIAAAAGLAPEVVLARPAQGLLVMRHVDGHVLTREDVREHAMLARIGAWFAKLHALAPPRDIAVVDIGMRAAGYLETLRNGSPAADLAELECKLAAWRGLLPPPHRLAACHHDLHHLNLIDCGDALVALDWEYAGPGDPAADLTACIGYHDLDQQQVHVLLAGYGGDPDPLLARLEPLRWIFDCLWFGWIETAARQGIAVDDARRRILVDRLTR